MNSSPSKLVATPLKTCPVGFEATSAPLIEGKVTVSLSAPVPSYTVLVSVPLFETHTGPAGL